MEQQKEQSHCPINLKLKFMHFSNAPVTLSTTNAFSLTHFLLNIYTTLKWIYSALLHPKVDRMEYKQLWKTFKELLIIKNKILFFFP